ncbi:MAG: tyrosine-type recombinase/integrase [Polyangia bacterium]
MSQIRIEGPYRHGDKWRCRLVLAGRRMWCRPSAPSPEAARTVAEGAARAAAQQGGLTVREAIARYEQHQRDKGSRTGSLRHWRLALSRFFAPYLDKTLATLTPVRCAECYAQLRSEPSERTGEPLSVDTHRGFLDKSKGFLNFCVESGWLSTNPLADVKGLGRRRKGKAQLRIDEARKLYQVALERAQSGDDGAAAVLVGLLMGFRPGEAASRTARDLDDGGRILWVDDTDTFDKKTESSRRAVQVPEPLQPILRALARDKVGAALLWSLPDGRAHGSTWVNRQAERLCALAGVPRVCAHSFRGLHATTALHAGATPELVATALGHESAAMTLRHYAAPGSKQASDQIARVRVLRASK